MENQIKNDMLKDALSRHWDVLSPNERRELARKLICLNLQRLLRVQEYSASFSDQQHLVSQ